MEASGPRVDLLNSSSVHHVRISPLMPQALGQLPSKYDMGREVFTKKHEMGLMEFPSICMLVVRLQKKILVEMSSISAVHLEMFLSGSSLSGFSPSFVLSLRSPHSCYSSVRSA